MTIEKVEPYGGANLDRMEPVSGSTSVQGQLPSGDRERRQRRDSPTPQKAPEEVLEEDEEECNRPPHRVDRLA